MENQWIEEIERLKEEAVGIMIISEKWRDLAVRQGVENMTFTAEIERLKEKPKNTWCAYCGHEVEIDDDAATKISEHIQSCPSHPMRAWERHCEALEEQYKALSLKLATITKENAALKADCEMYEAMKEGVTERIADLDDSLLINAKLLAKQHDRKMLREGIK